MKFLLGMLSSPLCVFAIATHPISSPVDFMGNNLPLLDGAVLSDSTLVVADSELTLWSSRDHGSTWESVPLDDLDGGGEIIGTAVVSSDRLSTWSFARGWVPMGIPPSYSSTDDSYFGTRGDRGYLDDVAGRIRYYRSTDGLRTWTEWFTMDPALVPAGSGTYGDMEVGRIWYLVSDSGYVRGTANGTTWTKSVLPADFEPSSFEPDDADTALQILGYVSENPVLARSGNFGATWRILPLSSPGGSVRRLTSGIWSSSTTTGMEPTPDLWLSRTPSGPWSKVDATGINACFAAGSAVLLATDSGLLEVDLSSTEIAPASRSTPFPSLRRIGNRIEIRLSPGVERQKWSLYSIDGSELGEGDAGRENTVIFCPRGAAWIRIGNRTKRVPPY